MVVVKLIGGLGNQLFQYATGMALAKERKQKLFVDKSAFTSYNLHGYGLHHFNTKPKVYKSNKITKAIQSKLKQNAYYNEDTFAFSDSIFNIKAKNVFLNGYFQSEKYFSKYRKELLKYLEITSPLKKETEDMLVQINNTNAVSVHIRRGDYLQHDVHNTSKEDYYLEAMKTVEVQISEPTYYLFSDDIDWVKQNFKTNHKAVYVDFNDANSNYEDLKLMSQCQHNIIANSSFSWWAAWLNTNKNKIVTAPKQWFNGDDRDYSTVVPNTWIKI